MKSRVLKRIMAFGLAVALFAGDTLPVFANDVVESVASEEDIVEEAAEEAIETNENIGDVLEETEEALDETEETEEADEEVVTIEEPKTPLEDAVEEEVVSLEPATVNDVTITVSGPSEAFDEGTFVTATELEPVAVEEFIENTEEEQQVIIKNYRAFDITLKRINEEGEEITVQPLNDAEVKVTFEGDMLIPNEATGEEVVVCHVDENVSAVTEEMAAEVVTVTDENENESEAIEMTTEHFSCFVIYVKKGILKISAIWKVVDSNNHNKPLAGAKFVLDKYYSNQKNGDYTLDKSKRESLVSDANGEISFTVEDSNKLPYYKYYLTETSAPSGYVKPTNRWEIVPVMYNNNGMIKVYDTDGKNDTNVAHFIGNENNINDCLITNDYIDVTYSIGETTKTASLIDWENRIYRLDLSTVVNAQFNPSPAPKKVVILADVSGSMIFTDAKIELKDMDPNKIYFTDTISDYQVKTIPYDSNVRNRLKMDGDYCYNVPSKGSYIFNINGKWYSRRIEWDRYDYNNLEKSGALDVSKATPFTGSYAYTNRSELLINALTQFINRLPDGTQVGIMRFNDSYENVTTSNSGSINKPVVLSDSTRTDLLNKVQKLKGQHKTATNPAGGFNNAASVFRAMGGLDDDCYMVFFADGEVSPSDNGGNYNELRNTKNYAEALKEQEVTVYSVGLGLGDSDLLKGVSSGQSYVKDSSDMEGVVLAFDDIATDIATTIPGTLSDTVSENFVICDAAGNVITDGVYDGATITTNANGQQVIVWDNIDISCNTATTKSFYVCAKDSFAGGNAVNTNAGESFKVTIPGVGDKSDESASVNVKADIEVKDNETEIFLGESLEESLTEEVLAGFTNASSTDYLNVSVKWYKDAKHTKEISLDKLKEEIPEEDTKYYCVVSVSPKTKGSDVTDTVKTAMNKDGVYYSVDEKTDVVTKEAVYTVKVNPATISFTKKEMDSEKVLGDVEFTLTRTSKKDSKLDTKWSENLVSDKNGLVEIENLDLRYEYTLTETVPEDYKLAGPWTISAKENESGEKYTWLIESTDKDDTTSVLLDKKTGEYTIYNEYGFNPLALASKKAEELNWDNRTYKVTLEAETRNQIAKVTEEEKIVKPVNVIFLLDASSSMRSDKDNYGMTALDKLQEQTRKFIGELPIDSEVSVVWFANRAEALVDGVKINSESDRASIVKNIKLPTKESGTVCCEGLSIIDGMLSDSAYENTFLILFTDGDTYVANNKTYRNMGTKKHDALAISKAASYKEKGVKVYSIGMNAKDDWGSDAKNLLVSMSSGDRYVMTCRDSDGIVKNFIQTEVKVGKESASVPCEADNVTLYDEISEYFDLTDANGNVITTEAEVKAAYGPEASLGSSNGLVTITFSNLSTKFDSTGREAKVSRVIFLKAKESFAGGNAVPTNGKYVVSVEDPKDPEKVTKDEFPQSPEVDVKCDFNPGEAFEEIFLGESLNDYWKVGNRKEEVENALSDYKTKYSNFDYMDELTIEWFYDKDCKNAVKDMTKETPEEKTVYYGKVTVEPKFKGKLEKQSVVGTYTVTILEGEIVVTKTITNLSEAEKLSYDGKPIFTFVLKDEKGATLQTKVVTFDNYSTASKTVSFTGLVKGTYSVEELSCTGWECVSETGNKNITINKTTPQKEASFENKAVSQRAFADKDVVVNSVTVDSNGKLKFSKSKASN